MPATVPTRGVLKASTNRVRTSTALQGNAMWENVIGIVNEQAGTNTGVEALINAPQHGGARKASAARRAAAHEAVMATGGFDTAITSYESLLTLAKSQGAVGGGDKRGACKVCGQLGHLTKQCRNQFSKYYDDGAGGEAGAGPSGAEPLPQLPLGGDANLSDSSLSSDSSASEDERRRKRKEKEKRKRKEKESKSKSSKERKHKRSRQEEKEKDKKKSRREGKERKSSKKSKSSKKKRSRSSSSSSSGSDSD